MRLFLISLGTLIITLFIGLIVRFWGLSLPYKKFEHPFFSYTEGNPQLVSIPVLSPERYEFSPNYDGKEPLFKSKTPELAPRIVWVNVYMTSDRHLITDYGFNVDGYLIWAREKGKFKGKFIHNYTLAELAEFSPNIVSLDTAVSSLPHHQFVLNILTNETDVHKDIIAFVEAEKLQDRVLVNSPIDIVIKAIKEKQPMWVYGTSISEASRVKSFSTLGLEPAITVRGDVFIAPISYLNRPLIDESLVAEMKRRKKFVFIGPVHNEQEKQMAEDLNPDGVIF